MRAWRLSPFYISQKNAACCNGPPCPKEGKYLLPSAMPCLPVNRLKFKNSHLPLCLLYASLLWIQLLMKDARLADLAIFVAFFSLRDRKRLWQSLILVLLQHTRFTSHQMRFTALLPGGKSIGVWLKSERWGISCHPGQLSCTKFCSLWRGTPDHLLTGSKSYHIHQYYLSHWAISNKVSKRDWAFFQLS